ncbi:hypothetical protein CTAYLR_010535 [Chrysophaeum taylorii]|uniref:Uncharacterized protein n=1 Tax=Chrysophaeum taylorii TaxID=2483200 RepID=A0AAD7UHY3_9STRA|nr:hypothetical protein CTAYLR_010535 [Chrysophaeum taylorii]
MHHSILNWKMRFAVLTILASYVDSVPSVPCRTGDCSSVGGMPNGGSQEVGNSPSNYDINNVIDIISLTDRITPLSAVLASVCVNTAAPLRFHLVVPDSALDEARGNVIPPQCAGAEWRLLVESEVVQSIRDSGLTVTWEVEVPLTNLSVHVPTWDRASKHHSVFNCLRFYLPRLPEFADLESIIFLDDDVIVQGDIAHLWELPLGKPLAAGCLNWIWTPCGRMVASSTFSYVDVPYLGFGALPHGAKGSIADLTCMSDDQKECAPVGFFESLAEASEAIQGYRLDIDELRNKRAWNFGLNKFNMTAWRADNVTERYIAWIMANKESGWFPTTSLAYGLGIPFLTLADEVGCMDDVGMPVLHGLGFVEPDDMEFSGVALDSIDAFYALHWNGDRKPYSWKDAIPEYADYFLAHSPELKKTESDKARRELAAVGDSSKSFVVLTAPRSGSEWFMNVIDQHENVCASGEQQSSGRGWPRESLLPSHLLADDVDVCQPKAICHWAVASRLLETLLLEAGDDLRIPSVCDSPSIVRTREHDYYGSHLGTLCAILERSVPATAATIDVVGGTRESWVTQVMHESFRVFVGEVLGGARPSLHFSSRDATDWTGRALSGTTPLQVPCACPSSTKISGTKVMSGWLKNDRVSTGVSNINKKYDSLHFTGVLEELGSKIIVLDREDIFASYVSLRVAGDTRRFHCRGSSCRHEGRVNVDVDGLLQFVQHTKRQREARDDLLAGTNFEVLHVQYESCVANQTACFQEVLEFLEVENDARVIDDLLAGASDAISLDTRSASERVVNIDEVAKALAAVGLEHYLTLEDHSAVATYASTFGNEAVVEETALEEAAQFETIEDVHVLVMSDRAPALAATLASMCSTASSVANLVIHLVLPDDSTDATWEIKDDVDACRGAKFEARSIASIERELRDRYGMQPVWMSWSDTAMRDVEAPKYARDRSLKHTSPFNLARFYVPILKEYEDVRRLVLLDDDVIVQGDIALAQISFADEDAAVFAGCQNWISTNGVNDDGTLRMSPNNFLRVFETPHFGFRRIQPGGELSDALCDNDADYDCMPSTFLASLSGAWKDVRCQATSSCPEDAQDDAIVRGLVAQTAWNFGLVSINLAAWREGNLTQIYHAWTDAAVSRGLFPAGSLAHGLGLAYLSLEDQVKCWESFDADEPHIDVLQGLGYILPQDLAAANLSTGAAYALHFNGEVKPRHRCSRRRRSLRRRLRLRRRFRRRFLPQSPRRCLPFQRQSHVRFQIQFL